MVVFADSAVVGISALITVALAALTLVAAAITIREARLARGEASRAHRDETKEQAALHREEMDERLEATLGEQTLQRLIRLGRIGELVGEVALIAGREAHDRGETKPDASRPLPAAPNSPVITLLKRLELEIRIYESLGSEPQEELRGYVERQQWLGLPRATIQTHAEKRLQKLAELVEREGETLSTLLDLARERYERHAVEQHH